MEQSANEGICLTCGFLCRRDMLNLALANYYEITQEDRKGGRLFLRRLEEHLSPCCFRNVPITDEIQDLSGVGRLVDDPPEQRRAQQTARNEAAKQVVSRDRKCSLWMEYQPGLGPQQHLGGLAMRESAQALQAFLESLERQRQAFERQLAASRDRFTLDLHEANERSQKLTTALTWAAVILAIAQVVAAVAALTCDSLLWMWLMIRAPGCP
jgi:hypothetical protein